MIQSFSGRNGFAEAIFNRDRPKRFPSELHRVALRKLTQLHAAALLTDLKAPPGNHLEALQGNLHGKHSIRINKQWRIVFRWENGHAFDVEIIDYH